MSKLRVNEITNTLNDGPVFFPFGAEGDGSKMTLRPGIETFNPAQLATDVAVDSVIEIGFNQNMQFSGVGTIYIREGSSSGNIFEEFECGVAVGASITSNLLTITPTTDFVVDTIYYVSLPSAGIANTLGATIQPLDNYQFQTVTSTFSAAGGDFEFVVADGNAPTGFYKYHVFANPGILTTNQPSINAVGMDVMMIGGGGAGGSGVFFPSSAPSLPSYYRYCTGGGGAGGLIQMTGPTLNIGTGNHNITVGAGGSACRYVDNPSSTVPFASRKGKDTVLSNPVVTITAFGGGYGGNWNNNNPGNELVNDLGFPSSNDYDWGCPGGSGGGGGGNNPVSTWSPGGTGVPGQGNAGNKQWNTRHPPSGGASQISGSSEINLGGGGGGAGGAGQQGTGYALDGPRPNYYGRHGRGGQGLNNPIFPNTVLAPRVTSPDPTTFTRMGPTGSYFAGGGAGGGSNPATPQPPGASQEGGYGGGGVSGRPWNQNSGGPSPVILEPPAPVDGSGMLGGGGGGGSAFTSPPNESTLNQRRAGDGGPGSVMIRYVHFS